MGGKSFWQPLSGLWRRVSDKLAEWDGANVDPHDFPPPKGWLHDWLPLAIVLVSLGAAAMGWQASVADERATHRDEISRQDLVRLSQLKLQKVQEVDADIRTYGEFERHDLMARELTHDAARLRGARARSLLQQARGEQGIALTLAGDLKNFFPRASTGAPYDLHSASVLAETGDTDLASLEPNQFRAAAKQQRDRGLHLTLLAVLFIVALVFFTLAAVSRGKRTATFAALGVTAAVVALVVFPFVRGWL